MGGVLHYNRGAFSILRLWHPGGMLGRGRGVEGEKLPASSDPLSRQYFANQCRLGMGGGMEECGDNTRGAGWSVGMEWGQRRDVHEN